MKEQLDLLQSICEQTAKRCNHIYKDGVYSHTVVAPGDWPEIKDYLEAEEIAVRTEESIFGHEKNVGIKIYPQED